MADGIQTALRLADRPDAAVPPAHHQAARRRRRLRWGLIALGPLLVLLIGATLWLRGGRYVSIDDAYVKADMINVATDVAGMVAAVAVQNNQPVAADQVLFRLDDEPFRFALANAEAALAQTRNDIEVLKASWRQRQETIKSDQVHVAYYEREFQRQDELLRKGFVARAQYDTAQRNLETARQTLAADRQQLAGVAAQLSGDPDIDPDQHPRVQQARAQRDQAARDLRRTVVKAARPGIVTNVDKLQAGQYLPAGTAAFSLVATDHVWVEANPKETELTHVKPGDAVTIAVDTYPGTDFHGTVESLSPASGAEFALLPAQNTSGNWVKVVQRIPIRLRVDTAPDAATLRAGMSVVATIDTGHKRTLASLF
jgi:membrane fusion protein (multidrug efflux system)